MKKISRFLPILISISMISSSSGFVLATERLIEKREVPLEQCPGGESCIGHTYKGNNNNHGIVVNDGKEHKIILDNINIDANNTGEYHSPLDIYNGSKVRLELRGENTLIGDKTKYQAGSITYDDYPGIWVDNAELTIEGTGKLNAIGGDRYVLGLIREGGGAGIETSNTGKVSITSGIVYAESKNIDDKKSIQGNVSYGNGNGNGNGNAVIIAPQGITDTESSRSGIFVSNGNATFNQGTINLSENSICNVYGKPTYNNNLVINKGATLNIGKSGIKATLTMNIKKTITNNGTLNITKDSELILKDGKEKQAKGGGTLNLYENALIRVPISDAEIKYEKNEGLTYNGNPQVPTIDSVETTIWGKTQTYLSTEDYSIENDNNTNADENATVSVKAKEGGKFLNGSTKTISFEIDKANPSGVDRDNWRIWKYDDSPVLPVPTFTGVDGNKLSGTVKWYFSENDTVIVEGKGGNLADKVKENSGSIDENKASFNVYFKFTPDESCDKNYNEITSKPMGIIITEKQPVTVVIKDANNKEIQGTKITNKYTKTPKALTVKLRDKGGSLITASNLTYTWEISDPQIASVEKKENQAPSAEDLDPSAVDLKINDVGTATIKVRVEADNHAKSTGVFKLEVTPKGLEVDDRKLKFGKKVYDGTNKIPEENIPEINNVKGIEDGDEVSVKIESATISGTDYSVGKKDVDVVYSLSGTDASKYTITDASKYTITDAIEITKIDDNTPGTIPARKIANLTIKNKQESEYKFDLSKLIPDKTGNIEIGTVSKFEISKYSDASNYIDSTKGLTISGNTLTVPVKYVDSTTTGTVGTITVDIIGQNFYTAGTINLVAENTSSGGGGTITPPKDPSKPDDEIIGDDRYDTAGKIADSMGDYDSAILVNATKTLSDGLSAASISGKEKAPILLTKKDSIPEATMKRLAKAKTVYIIGGEEAISKKVESQLKGKKIIRLGGDTRFETSLEIEEYIGDYDKAFIVNGYTGEADAMSASAAAAKYNAPIILTNGKSSEYKKESEVSYYAIGGKTVLSDNIVKTYSAKRIGGSDRYKTNRMFIEEFYPYSATYYFTKGEPLVDALTASYIARNSGVVLVSKNSDNSILKGKELIQIGGMPFSILPLK